MKSLFFNQRNRQPLFYSAKKRPGYPGKVKEQCIMQQATINFTASEVRQPVSLRERMRSTGREINEWLDTRSAFYSRIAEFEVTRRAAIRIGIVLPMAIVVAVACVEQAPLVSITAMTVSGWIVYRLNKSEKGGEA